MDGINPSDLYKIETANPPAVQLPDEPGAEGMINVFTPDGNLVSIPKTKLDAALFQGFEIAPPEKVDRYFKEQEYGTLNQQLLTGLEGFGRGATFNLTTPMQVAAGEPVEKIEARREVNPVTHTLGEVAGLTASMLATPFGAGSLLAKAGQKGAVAAGLGQMVERVGEGGRIFQEFQAPVKMAPRIGSAAIRNATEAALWQGSDEVSKMLAGQSDPADFAETGLINIGLAGVIGGGLGASLETIPAIWSAKAGPKVEEALQLLKDRVDNLKVPVPEALAQAQKELGVELPAEMKAATQPWLAESYRAVKESPGKAGIALRETEEKAKKEITEQVLKTLDVNENELLRASQVSDAQAGRELGEEIKKELDKKFAPQVEKWEKIEEKLAKSKLTQSQDIVADRLAILARQNGWDMAESQVYPIYNALMKRVGEGEFQTADQLKKYITNILNPASAKDWTLRNPIRLMRNELEDVMVDAYNSASRNKGSKFAVEYAQAKADYAAVKGQVEELTDRLRPAKFFGTGYKGLKAAIDDMKPEDIVNRLTRGNDSGLLEALQANFPTLADRVRRYGIRDLFTKSVEKANPGELFNPLWLSKSLDNTTPEYRKFLFPQGEGQLQSVRTLLQYFPKHQTSATAHNLDQMLGGAATGIGFIHALLSGANPVTGAVTGYLAKLLARDVPDHVRLGLLKFFGSNQPINAPAFKAMVDYIGHVAKGENVLLKGAKAIFASEKVLLPKQIIPDEKDRKKLQKQIDEMRVNPDKMLKKGTEASYYLPDANSHITMVAQNAMNYLNNIKPAKDKMSPFDAQPMVSKAEQATYNRALDLAISPAIILPSIQEGTITFDDMKHLRAMYPKLTNRMIAKISNEMMDSLSKDALIPFKTKMGLSVFLGQPLDTILRSESILAAQPIMQTPEAQQPNAMPKATPARADKLAKMPGSYMTQLQKGEAQV